MKKLLIVSMVMIATLLSSCSIFSPNSSKWRAQKEGIVLHLQSDDKLNYKDGKYYTLFMVVYQLTKPDSFNLRTQDEEGLRELLSKKIFDSSVVALKSIIIYPSSNETYKIDRATGAKHVAVIAGYRTMNKERMVRVFDIPLGTDTDILKMEREYVPEVLEVTMKFGATQIDVLNKKK
ncbi:MAG: type VI secretion system lipoprotein TssJ [Desulfobacteraceae bacterium]|nr:type VI secretion system lipoprotein TssJ [Desulfobacteraceae bacterium]